MSMEIFNIRNRHSIYLRFVFSNLMKIMIMKNMRLLILLSVILVAIGMGNLINAQTVEKEWQTRMAFKTSVELLDDLTFEISPELRFDNNFKLDKYLLEGELEYEFLKRFSAGAGYRFLASKKEEWRN